MAEIITFIENHELIETIFIKKETPAHLFSCEFCETHHEIPTNKAI